MAGAALRGLRAFFRHLVGRGAERDEAVVRASEERLRVALSSGRTVAWEWDLRKNRIVRSENATELLGLPVESDARDGAEFAERIHPDDRERVGEAVRRALETRQPVAAEFRLVRPDGTVLWLLDDGQFEVDERGEPVRMRGIIRDITERKEVELALEQNERRFRSLSEASPVGIFVADSHGSCEYTNRRCQEICGFTAEEAQGEGWMRVVHPADRDRVLEEWRRSVEGGRSYTGEARLAGPVTGARLVHIRSEPMRADDGTLLGHVGTVEDVTDHREIEALKDAALRAEQEARREAQAANRAKDEFLAVLSHELRTPLTSMLGWVRMLQSGTLDRATTARALSVVERNTRLQAQLIDDLLDVSRIASGKLELDRALVNPVTVVEAALDSLRAVAQERGLALETSLDPCAGCVWADAARLQQVVWNLVSNAIKFTPSGGRVTVRLDSAGDRVQIAVEDTGKGIAPEFLPYVFDRFRQADSTHTRSHGGLGLGLTIVRELVERHGGSVRAESTGEGAGATFVVTLPASAAASGAAVAAPAPGADEAPPEQGLHGVRVLIVDDEGDARGLFAAVLSGAGAEVTSAESAVEALALIADANPHVLLSDIAMPGVDGYELIRRVRGLDGAIGRIPAVAVTAYARTEDQDRAMRAGFDGHLAKPVEPGRLVGLVSQLAHAAPLSPPAGARRRP